MDNQTKNKNLSLVISMKEKQIFKEYCPHCGYELEIYIDSKYNSKSYWCRGRCADEWNN